MIASIGAPGSYAPWLIACLWILVGLLTIAVVVRMRHPWWRIRPIAQCVVLSLVAHVILATTAFSTRLVVDPIGLGPLGPPVQFTLLDGEEDAVSSDSQDAPDSADRNVADATAASPAIPEPPDSATESADPDVSADGTAHTVSVSHSVEPPGALAQDASFGSGEGGIPLEPDEPTDRAAMASDDDARAGDRSNKKGAGPEPARAEPEPVESNRGQVAESTPDRGQEPIQDEHVDPVRDPDANRVASASNVAAPASEPSSTSPWSESPSARSTWVSSRSADASPIRRETPEVYRGRSERERRRVALASGGSEASEEAVERGLAWLVAHQAPDGRWDATAHGAGREQQVLGHDRGGAGAGADTGITGLALLALLGAGHTHLDGAYRESVRHGLEFLLNSQRPDGSLAGDSSVFAAMYCHGIAFLAVSEAHAMTDDPRLTPYVRRAQRFTLASQIPNDGGWRYQRGDAQGDMSQFGWQVMALRSAELGGIAIPASARRGMLDFLTASAAGEYGGKTAYRVGARPSRTMTAEALVCRVFLHAPAHRALVDEACAFCGEEPPGAGPTNLYYWYYATLALYQVKHPQWPSWNARLQEALLSRQERVGEHAGSWPTDTVWGGYGGRVYTTAMATLCLEVYYRHLRLLSSGSGAEGPIEEATRAAPWLRR
ncbi:MAG: hypothetical protein FJ297_06530 [Planctomycetes bacterium]|nr:hypothetical protein [Planctomycetota bacterium]